MPTVSVIIPNYNHAKYLRRRIDSVLAQTFQDFEIILLDDCSTDGSQNIIESYRGNTSVSHIVYNEENSGSPFKQWEKGIMLAKGKYIWIAESDDWCECNLLASLLPPLEADSRCVISYCQCYMVDDEGRIKSQSHYPRLQESLRGDRFVREHMVKGNAIWNASMAIWRRELYAGLKKDFLDYRFCGDWLFWIRLALTGTVNIDGRVLNYFRKHDGDVSGPAYSSGYNFVEELHLLSTVYKEGIIGDVEYKVGYKAKFRDFWRRRQRFDTQVQNTIMSYFRKPASKKISYVKVLGSAIWDNWKHPSRKH